MQSYAQRVFRYVANIMVDPEDFTIGMLPFVLMYVFTFLVGMAACFGMFS